jgi:flagellar protein FlgJ
MRRLLRCLLLVLFTLPAVPAAAAPEGTGLAAAPGAWVYTTVHTNLWSGGDAAAVAFGAVGPGRPLLVETVGGDRLQVRDPGDGLGQSGGPAWVDRAAVEATEQPRHWFGPADPARGVELWSGPDERAELFGVAGAGRPLAWAGEPVGNRLPVLVADEQPGLAWASLAGLVPAPVPPADSPAARAARMLPPEFPPPAPAPAVAPVVSTTAATTLPPVSQAERDAFVADWGERARRLRSTTNVPPSLVVAMAINETGWGRSRLAREANNFFGIKATTRPGTAGVLTVETWEVVDGQDIRLQQSFRAYNSPDESLLDLGRHLKENARYAAVWTKADDPDAFARALLAGGYATDPAWADKLARIRSTYDLDRLNR